MFRIIFFLITVISYGAVADTHQAAISYIDYPVSGEKDTLLYLSDALVVKLPARKDITFYEEARRDGTILEFTTDDERYVLEAEEISPQPDEEMPSEEPFENFTPSVLKSPEEARTIFNSLRRNSRSSSQCYNRAHVWAYESRNKYQLDSMKVFMFYTRKYIREYNFHWWFHVAPFTYIGNNGSAQESVLDRKFTKGPTDMKSWTDIFMKNKVTCPVISKYTDYENHQEKEYCYLYKASMYYVQPLDLEKLEETGRTKNQWLDYELRRAYWNGFGM